ncbi:Uncharacterised protein [uncultured archaeon]|nr:Uncharacterised protein [uncultured archaeon]
MNKVVNASRAGLKNMRGNGKFGLGSDMHYTPTTQLLDIRRTVISISRFF